MNQNSSFEIGFSWPLLATFDSTMTLSEHMYPYIWLNFSSTQMRWICQVDSGSPNNMPDVGKNRTIDESLPKKHHFLNCLSSVGRNLSDSVSTHRLRVQNLQCPDCKKHLGWEEWGPPGWMERAGWEGC